jgi:hypothetical protein
VFVLHKFPTPNHQKSFPPFFRSETIFEVPGATDFNVPPRDLIAPISRQMKSASSSITHQPSASQLDLTINHCSPRSSTDLLRMGVLSGLFYIIERIRRHPNGPTARRVLKALVELSAQCTRETSIGAHSEWNWMALAATLLSAIIFGNYRAVFSVAEDVKCAAGGNMLSQLGAVLRSMMFTAPVMMPPNC